MWAKKIFEIEIMEVIQFKSSRVWLRAGDWRGVEAKLRSQGIERKVVGSVIHIDVEIREHNE